MQDKTTRLAGSTSPVAKEMPVLFLCPVCGQAFYSTLPNRPFLCPQSGQGFLPSTIRLSGARRRALSDSTVPLSPASSRFGAVPSATPLAPTPTVPLPEPAFPGASLPRLHRPIPYIYPLCSTLSHSEKIPVRHPPRPAFSRHRPVSVPSTRLSHSFSVKSPCSAPNFPILF